MVWGYFIRLHNSRQSGMSANPISYQEIYAFDKLYRLGLHNWEIDAIVALDRVALTAYGKQQEEQSNNKKNK